MSSRPKRTQTFRNIRGTDLPDPTGSKSKSPSSKTKQRVVRDDEDDIATTSVYVHADTPMVSNESLDQNPQQPQLVSRNSSTIVVEKQSSPLTKKSKRNTNYEGQKAIDDEYQRALFSLYPNMNKDASQRAPVVVKQETASPSRRRVSPIVSKVSIPYVTDEKLLPSNVPTTPVVAPVASPTNTTNVSPVVSSRNIATITEDFAGEDPMADVIERSTLKAKSIVDAVKSSSRKLASSTRIRRRDPGYEDFQEDVKIELPVAAPSRVSIKQEVADAAIATEPVLIAPQLSTGSRIMQRSSSVAKGIGNVMYGVANVAATTASGVANVATTTASGFRIMGSALASLVSRNKSTVSNPILSSVRSYDYEIMPISELDASLIQWQGLLRTITSSNNNATKGSLFRKSDMSKIIDSLKIEQGVLNDRQYFNRR